MEAVDATLSLGVGDEFPELSEEEVQQRCASSVFGGGAFMRTAATVRSARVARGLWRVLADRGVPIFEDTHVNIPRLNGACVAVTADGSVTARAGVAAVNAWGVAWPVLRRLAVTRGSYMIMTESISHRPVNLLWTGRKCFTDSTTAVPSFRTTQDGRITFHGGGALTSFGSSIGRTHSHDRRAVGRIAEGFRRLFPSLADVCLKEAWGGPIDVDPFHLPAFDRLVIGNWWFGIGYTGNGVGSSHMAGKILSSLCLDQENQWTDLPMVKWRPRRYAPQTFRSIGAGLLNGAAVWKGRQEERRIKAGAATDFFARLPAKLGHVLPRE